MNDSQGKDLDVFKEELKTVLIEVVKKTVNGKIDRLHEEITEYNKVQDRKLEDLKESVEGVVTLYGSSSTFFRGIIVASKFVIAVGGASAVVWSFIKLMAIATIQK